MKRYFSLLLGLVVAFSALLVSCDGNENEMDSPICEIVVESDGNGKVAVTNHTGLSVTILKGNSLEVVATPDDGYEFLGWFVGDDANPVSKDATYTFVVSRSVVLVAKFAYPFVSSGSVDGHEYVDLGLPSGLKWATCNVGATEINDKGVHYAWGETEEKTNFTRWENYRLCNGTDEYMTRYNGHDDKKILDLGDDVAHSKWGGDWRMPTKAEMQELCDNCTFESVKVNGMLGLKVKGPNGRCIFLPAASYKGSTGNVLLGWMCYWSSTVSPDDYAYACSLEMFIGSPGQSYAANVKTAMRRLGYSIRPVAE